MFGQGGGDNFRGGIAVMCGAELGWIVLPRIYVDGGRIVMCVVGKIEALRWHSAFPELRVWYSRRGFVRTKKIVKK